jgi:serine/threonine protein kinase
MRRASSTPPELSGYSYVRLLGSGGFSDVFLYDQKLPKRRVAVKVLLTEELTPANRASFVSEANLMAQLSAHPYIVTIYHADVASDDRPYFVMEYCSGPSLAERYKRETFAVADALRTGVRVSSAIATAHSAGILHRDIKPANVLTNDFGWPALTDFGISSAVDEELLPIHTGTLAEALQDTGSGTGSQSIGMSIPWSPPEMFEDDPHPDVRSDVFSLAATIYTIIAGYTPFEVRGRSNGTLDLIGRIERGAITPIGRDDVPRSLIAVLQKGMASDRADRFQTAVDFARALQRVELELGYSPTAIDVPNLLIDAPERQAAGTDEDETRARSVATIDAQPIATFTAPPTGIAPPPAAAAPADADATQLRGAPQQVVAQPSDLSGETVVRPRAPKPVEPPPMAIEHEAPQKTSRTNRIVILVSAVAAVLIAAAVVVAFVVNGGAPSAGDDKPKPVGSGDSAVVESIPTPKLVSKAPSGSTLVFTIANPSPQKGDSYVWQISNRTGSEPRHPLKGDVVTIQDYVEGSTVCVQVWIVRQSQTSATPLESCYPT